MAEFKITRFRYTWKGDWDSNTVTYYKDDVVFHEGSSWVCIRQHVSDVFDDAQTYTAPGDTFASPAWAKMADGRKFRSDWQTATSYDTGALVVAGGNVYLCINSHVSSTYFNDNINDWEVFAVGNNFRNTWTANTRYRVGDVIRYNGYTYQCVLEHTSGTISQGVIVGNNDSQDDSTAETWTVAVENYSYVGVYQSNTRYRINDLVKYGGSILKCITEHTSSGITGQITSANFVTYLPGYSYEPVWSASQYYAIGDVVQYGGTIYTASVNNYNSQPGVSELNQNGNTDWAVIQKAINYRGQLDPQSRIGYKQGDLVQRGGALWISLTDQVDTEDSTLVTLDDSNWEIVIAAQNFRGGWKTNEDYNLYDQVYYRGVLYYANVPHTSALSNFPGDNGEGFNYWNIVALGDVNAALNNLGDMLTYNLTRYIIEDGSTLEILGDESSIGATNIPIGNTDEFLVVEDNLGNIGYKVWGTLQRFFFVSKNGVDDITDTYRGINYFKPWKTLRYALEQADDDYDGNTTIFVYAGEYQEVLPLIVPANVAVVGMELRSTTIRANEPIEALANDAQYTLETLIHLGTKLGAIILGNAVSSTLGNNEITSTIQRGTSNEVTEVANLWGEIISWIDFKINDSGSLPSSRGGSNTLTGNGDRIAASNALNNNRNWLKAEAIAFMEVYNPTYSFDTEKCRRDIDKFIDAVIYDLKYPGNYKSLLAARYYANAVMGSQLEDMFYVRNSTGIRNLTLKGLNGTLPALQAGEVYRIPTAGAYVSLDPGWGPDDERVWITTRSCYVQNVTTFGTGAVGQKIDGLLHNGGNRSIVSNDFTQVISDGIGAWVQNGGRAELVSVFTYYCHIGMFAKDGGIIRATNGNSSYGTFGAVADNIDPAEVVKYGYLNTRTEQAQIAAAFAGEILDYILALEFINCGQNYTTASYTITSSGAGAVAQQEEFRDNALFNIEVVSAGSGFTQYGNQAQTGNTLTITLATAETATEADILGMRLIITSGEGTGQYGYVQAYNSLSKVCTIYRESDGQPGWDHILPGTPSNPLLTTGTRYRIEPRPIFSDPTYSATEVTFGLVATWASVVYGETSQVFAQVVGSPGTGSTIDITPLEAEWTVVKSGRSYSVTLTDGGAGYQAGDTIIIDGADVGGISGENDITITVISTTEDSTNSIVSFDYGDDSIIASAGKFILLPSSGTTGRYSSDGDTWTIFDLPISGNWKSLAAGKNSFVALSYGSDNAVFSSNAVDWTTTVLPYSRNWQSVVYGKPSGVNEGIFVAVADNLNAGAYSTNGQTWFDTTLPVFGDSTFNNWVDITFGRNIFVAIANSGNIAAVGTWNGSSLTWQGTIMDVIADSSQQNWVSVAYGNRRFVAISSQGDVAYSFDGIEWLPATLPTQDGSTKHNWQKIRYGQGVFFAVGDTGGANVGADPTTGPTTFAATSYDGIVWTPRTLATEETWGLVAFGNPDTTLGDSTLVNSKPTWIVAPTVSGNKINKVYVGAKALGRAVVDGTGISYIKIWEPGSGYDSEPTVTLYDPSKVVDPTLRLRTADGVLAQPVFTTKGAAYKSSTTSVTVLGDGFADITPNGKFITLDNLEYTPGPGAQLYIGGRLDYFVAVIVGINEIILPNGRIRSTFQISPRAKLIDNLEHGMEVVIREKYSQVRITGHDFLDVGVGNAIDTNYPDLYTNYVFEPQPLNEVYNIDGGRVFYTSTDQDGNFRAGEQFAVEQATGIITIAADFFDLAGLTELRLAGINVGSTAVIREFSKDPLFLQNSNNIIPTQRAIISYLQSRLNVGGEDLLTPSIIAGTVKVGPNSISNTAGLTVEFPNVADFSGSGAGISGSIVAQTMFFRSFRPAG